MITPMMIVFVKKLNKFNIMPHWQSQTIYYSREKLYQELGLERLRNERWCS